MKREPKGEEIKVRVTTDVKNHVAHLAELRGETESMIVREALMEYLAKKPRPPVDPSVNEAPLKYPADKIETPTTAHFHPPFTGEKVD